jgi:cysteine desulfurase/selenocysteine lyase
MSDALQFATLARGRELIAGLIGATTEEIALATNTTYGLNLAAFSLPLSPGDVIVTPDKEFPANVYPWMQAAKIRGVEYRRVHPPEGVIDTATVLEALNDPRVKILSVSWVGFAFGSRLDLQSLGDACRERGIYFVVDAMQGLGPLTLDLSKLHVDILACGAQKWLLGPWGAGFVYVRKHLVQRLEPHDVSWLDVRGSEDFRRLMDYDLTWRDDARRFEFITLPYQDFAGMNASLDLIHELGPSHIAAHIAELTRHIVDWASDRDGIELVTPSDPDRRGGIVSVRSRDPDATSVRLKQARVVHTVREGAVRLSPHCYNTIAEIDYALDVIATPSS